MNACCCCGNHGQVKLEATFDKTAYNQMETIKVRLHVNNTKMDRKLETIAMRLSSIIEMQDPWFPDEYGKVPTNAASEADLL